MYCCFKKRRDNNRGYNSRQSNVEMEIEERNRAEYLPPVEYPNNENIPYDPYYQREGYIEEPTNDKINQSFEIPRAYTEIEPEPNMSPSSHIL